MEKLFSQLNLATQEDVSPLLPQRLVHICSNLRNSINVNIFAAEPLSPERVSPALCATSFFWGALAKLSGTLHFGVSNGKTASQKRLPGLAPGWRGPGRKREHFIKSSPQSRCGRSSVRPGTPCDEYFKCLGLFIRPYYVRD